MRRGLPTFILILVSVLALGAWSWWMGRQLSEAQAADAPASMVARPIPAGGWGPLQVMAANIRLDEPGDGANAWLRRRELVVKTFLKYQPDVLGCQEVSPAQGAFLNKELAQWYGYFPRAGIGTQPSAGAAAQLVGAISESLASLNTIYYRIDRLDAVDGEAGLVLPNEPQAAPGENTFFSLVVLKEKAAAGKQAKTVIAVDVHLRHDTGFAARCAAEIHRKLDAWMGKYPGSGVVVIGDMNHDRTEAPYPALTGSGPQAGKMLALTDTFDYAHKPAGELWGTFHNFTGKSSREWPTDLIFVGGALELSKAARIERDASADGHFPSDHFFIGAELKWHPAG